MASQNTHKFIAALIEDRLADADGYLSVIVQEKVAERIRNVETELDEGFFDRLGAKSAGAVASIGAKAKNFGTKVGGGVSAAKSALGGNFDVAAGKLSTAQATTNKNDPAAAGKQAKLDSITASIKKDLQNLFPNDPGVQDVLDALADLGKAPATPPPLPNVPRSARQPHPFSRAGKSSTATTPVKKVTPAPVSAPAAKKAPVSKPVVAKKP